MTVAAGSGAVVGPRKLGPGYRTPFDVVVFAACVAVGAGLILLALFGVYPFAGTIAAYVFGFLLEAAGHAVVVSLLVAAFVEARHPRWTFWGTLQHVTIGVAAVVAGVGLLVVDRWMVHVGLGTWATWEYFIAAVVASAAAGVVTYLVMRPDGFEGSKQAVSVHVLAGIGGLAGGALAVVATIGVLAAYRQGTGGPQVPIPTVSGINGPYVALGDSYSAGEGLRPFDPPTVSGAGDGCHRSISYGYPRLLVLEAGVPEGPFPACSGAVTADVYTGFSKDGPPPVDVAAQVDGAVHADVGLVTITSGGDDALFSVIVRRCFTHSDCTKRTFRSPPASPGRLTFPDSKPLNTWGPEEITLVSGRSAVLYAHLRQSFPNARIVAIGYPYLFPVNRAGLQPNDCASILRRFSLKERTTIRNLTDDLNNAMYEQAVAAHIEFVSPKAVWAGHEPCGNKGQYVNSIKPLLNVTSPVDGGSFHPTRAGQQQLAALVACYLDLNRQPPNPFVGGSAKPFVVTTGKAPSDLGLVDAPGSESRLVCSGGR